MVGAIWIQVPGSREQVVLWEEDVADIAALASVDGPGGNDVCPVKVTGVIDPNDGDSLLIPFVVDNVDSEDVVSAPVVEDILKEVPGLCVAELDPFSAYESVRRICRRP